MAGWDNDIAYSNNADYSTAGATGGSLANGLITNGELWIGRTAVNVGGTHISVGNLVSPDSSITVGYTAPNITLTANAANIPYISLTPYIVGKPGDTHAGFFTIQSAIDAAVSDGASASTPLTVKIKPGIYTEDLTLHPWVSLTGQGCDAYSPSVTIVGAHTYSQAGSVTIANISFDATAQHIFALSGTVALSFIVTGCNFQNIANGEFVLGYTNTNASSTVYFTYCFTGATASSASFADIPGSTPRGSLVVDHCYFQGVGGFSGSVLNLVINSSFFQYGTLIVGDIGTLQVWNSIIGDTTINAIVISISQNAGSHCFVYNSVLISGTERCIVIESGATATISNSSISSSNTNAIAQGVAAGTLVYDNISFFGSSSTIQATLTQTLLQFTGAKVRANGLAFLNGGTAYKYTATAVSYPVLVSDVIIGVTSTASARTITMPNSGMTTGQRWTIKDESGGAGTNNITISGNGANVDGASTFVMNSNFQSADIYFNGTNFFIV